MAEGLAQRLDRSLLRLRRRTLLPVLLLSVAWGQELVDQFVFAGHWNLPMVPRGPFWGLLTAPFSHAGFGHLISNSLWFLPLSWLVLLKGSRDYLAVWIAVLAMEIPVWLFWPSASHGLSGVNYALLGAPRVSSRFAPSTGDGCWIRPRAVSSSFRCQARPSPGCPTRLPPTRLTPSKAGLRSRRPFTLRPLSRPLQSH
jgi:membrane associated rhomboid family serine protease